MRYKKLLEILLKMKEDDLDKDVTLELDDELYPLFGIRVAEDEDTVDSGTLILVLKVN